MENQFSDYYFSSYHENSSKIEETLSTKMTITRKIKIGKILNLTFLSCMVIVYGAQCSETTEK